MNSKIALCAWRWSWNRVRSSSSHSTVAKKLLLRSFAGHGVVVTVPDRAHRRCHARLAAAFTEGHRRVLATLVGVMDDRARASLSHRHVQCVEHQFGAQMVGHRTPHHPAAEHIEYDGQVQESRRSRDVGVGSGRSALSSLERWVSPGPALRTGRAALTASGSPCAHAVGYDGRYWPSPNGAASSAWRVPATRPRSGRATKRRYSPATSSPRIDAANTLDPLRHVHGFPVLGLLRVLRPTSPASTGDRSSPPYRQGPTKWFPRSLSNPSTGSVPSYAPATSPRLRRSSSPWPPGRRHQPAKEFPARPSRSGARCNPAPICQVRAGGLLLRGFLPLVPRVHLSVSLAGPAPSDSAGASRRCQGCFRLHRCPPGSGCPQLQPARCDGPMAVVSHHRKVQERLVALDVGHPQPVRGLGLEATLDQVRRGAGLGVTTRGARPLATTHSGQACLTHHPRHPLAAHRRALSGQLGVNPRRPVRPTAAFVNRSHARAQRLVRGLARRALTGAPRVVPARGDTEYPGYRGGSKRGLIRSHEPVDLPGTVSRANQAVAFAKMSRSSRSRRFSRRRRRSSSRSAVLGPSPRRPSSRSACTTQLRIACAVGSNSRDNSSGLRPARTNSTIWRRNSGAYGGLDLGMVDTSSPKGQVSTNSGQLQTAGSSSRSLISGGASRTVPPGTRRWPKPRTCCASSSQPRFGRARTCPNHRAPAVGGPWWFRRCRSR